MATIDIKERKKMDVFFQKTYYNYLFCGLTYIFRRKTVSVSFKSTFFRLSLSFTLGPSNRGSKINEYRSYPGNWEEQEQGSLVVVL